MTQNVIKWFFIFSAYRQRRMGLSRDASRQSRAESHKRRPRYDRSACAKHHPWRSHRSSDWKASATRTATSTSSILLGKTATNRQRASARACTRRGAVSAIGIQWGFKKAVRASLVVQRRATSKTAATGVRSSDERRARVLRLVARVCSERKGIGMRGFPEQWNERNYLLWFLFDCQTFFFFCLLVSHSFPPWGICPFSLNRWALHASVCCARLHLSGETFSRLLGTNTLCSSQEIPQHDTHAVPHSPLDALSAHRLLQIRSVVLDEQSGER